MARKVKAIPRGYRSVTPYLCVKGAAQAIRFYKKAFGAKEVMRMPAPGGTIGHAELMLGDSKIMLADEFPQMGFRSPGAYGGSAVTIHLYVENVDQVFKRALRAGAKERQSVKDQFYGDRSGQLEDPCGHLWILATHVEDMSPQEMKRRGREFMKKNPM
ncbi:MAG: VOC family protein [Betaproteobacteria bacterium]|nr:VOC family protein [Betaproteobacteria bacterium]